MSIEMTRVQGRIAFYTILLALTTHVGFYDTLQDAMTTPPAAAAAVKCSVVYITVMIASNDTHRTLANAFLP